MAGTVPAGMSPGRTGRPGDPYGGDPGPVREPSGPRPRAGPGAGPAAAAPGLEAYCQAGSRYGRDAHRSGISALRGRWWGGRDGVLAEAVLEEVEGAFGALPRVVLCRCRGLRG